MDVASIPSRNRSLADPAARAGRRRRRAACVAQRYETGNAALDAVRRGDFRIDRRECVPLAARTGSRAHRRGSRLAPRRAASSPADDTRCGFSAAAARNRQNAPAALFIVGDTSALWQPQLAIVGSRNASAGGIDNARCSRARHRAAGFAVTSGLAEGIDAAAHVTALDADAITIAVIGTGPDLVYPRAPRALAARITRRGALVSEFPPGTPGRPEHFPRRNRIIAALALGTLVVEAGLRSGSLITARLANEQGRDVFAIPGSIHNPFARGCHALIRHGASLVETTDECSLNCSGRSHAAGRRIARAVTVGGHGRRRRRSANNATPISRNSLRRSATMRVASTNWQNGPGFPRRRCHRCCSCSSSTAWSRAARGGVYVRRMRIEFAPVLRGIISFVINRLYTTRSALQVARLGASMRRSSLTCRRTVCPTEKGQRGTSPHFSGIVSRQPPRLSPDAGAG